MKQCLLSVLIVSVLFFSGCIIQKGTGGGWIIVDEDGRKVNFAFQVQCKEGKALAMVQVNDPHNPNGAVRFHGSLKTKNIEEEIPCGEPIFLGENSLGYFLGEYTPQPKKLGDGGLFVVLFTDAGEPGPSSGDGILIVLGGGKHDGYTISGILGGGNIQMRQ